MRCWCEDEVIVGDGAGELTTARIRARHGFGARNSRAVRIQ